MTRRILAGCSLLAFWLCPLHSHAQQQANDTAAPVVTLQTSAHLVVLDVVVTDNHDRPVQGLHAQDFTLLDNGQPQKIAYFTPHWADAPAKTVPLPTLPPDVFTNYTPTPAGSAVNILLLDTLNTSMKDQVYVHQQLVQFLKHVPPETQIAIFGLTTQLHLLQGFTSDPRILQAIVDGKKTLAQHSPLLHAEMQDSTLGNSPNRQQMMANMQQFTAEEKEEFIRMRVLYTLDAMDQLARYLANIPGRKNLIWFSGSFPLAILPDGAAQDPFAMAATYSEEMKQTAEMLTLSRVAVYPVDARGLANNPAFSAAHSGAQYARNPQAFSRANLRFFRQTAAEHETMSMLAEATGGQAFYNTNGLWQATQKAIHIGSNYYTLAYTPTNTQWNGDFRKIQVKLAQAGYHLAYRHGYFAGDPTTGGHGNHAPHTNELTDMQAAMLRGAPEPTQIVFDAAVFPLPATSATALPQGNQPNTQLMHPPYRQFLLRYAVPLQGIPFHNVSGRQQNTMQFTVVAYNQDGTVINTQSNTAELNLKPETYAKLLKNGLGATQEIALPSKGDYYLRIGVQEQNSDKLGAVEVPVSALSPVTVTPPAAAHP